MLMVAVIVFGHFTVVRGGRMSIRTLLVLIAHRHRHRVQVLQRHAGNQHQQREFFQEILHAAILIGHRRTWQVVN